MKRRLGSIGPSRSAHGQVLCRKHNLVIRVFLAWSCFLV